MPELQRFPDVDPVVITAAGQQFQQAATQLETAGTGVQAVAGSTAWTSRAARPSWDSTLSARRADIADAYEVTEHVGNVLRTTGAELARLKSDYQFAILMTQFYPDPRVGHVQEIGGAIIGPDATTVDPQALAQYAAQVTKANDAVDDAEYALALCARELMSVSAVTFPPLPSGAPAVAVDPTTFAIIPIAPAFGAPSGAVFANGVPVQFPAGKAFEAQILRTLGISGDAKSFFRPNGAGTYGLPRTASGRLVRGTFPDSMRAGLLEIKSGTSELTMKIPQLQVQRFVARTLGVRWNLVVGGDTQVGDDVLDGVERTGGAVYRRVPGQGSTFRDVRTGQLVRLQGGTGVTGKDLTAEPLTPEETRAVAMAERLADEDESGIGDPDTAGPAAPGPAAPYTTAQEYDSEWANADVSPDGDTPLPGSPTEPEPGGPLVPGGEPVEPVEPIEPILPIDPEEFLP